MSVGIVNNNSSAVNTFRHLSGTSLALNKSLERLSSGLRINRAADDAAGLAVSEKMRMTINGLEQAQNNVQDGISMLKTAEASLDTTQSILHRMNRLATQAANSHYTTSDRMKLQDEIDELIAEVDRISQYSEFNTQKLLNGNLSGVANSNRTKVATASVVGRVTSSDFSIVVNNAGRASNVHGVVDFADNNGDGSNTLADLGVSGTAQELQITLDGSTRVVLLDETDTIEDVITKINRANLGVKAGTRAGTGGENYLTMTSMRSGQRFNISFGSDPHGIAGMLGLFGGNNTTNSYSVGAISGVGNRAAFTSGTETRISIINITNQSLFPTDIGYGVSLGQFTSQSDIFTEKELTVSNNASITSRLAYSNLLKGLVIRIDENLDYGFSDEEATDTEYFAATPFASTRGVAGVGSPAGAAASALFAMTTRISVRNNNATFHIGSGANQTVSASFGAMDSESLGLKVGLRADGDIFNGISKLHQTQGFGMITENHGITISVETRESAEEAIPKIQAALEKVSGERAKYGALQNSLEKAYDRLSIEHENQVASESQIRDVDMAREVSEFTKRQILLQSGTAMLAQANLKPQTVLTLIG